MVKNRGEAAHLWKTSGANGGNGNGGATVSAGGGVPLFLNVSRLWLEQEALLARAFESFERRGPERSSYVKLHDPLEVRVGFHRLSIMDPTANGDQPFVQTYVGNREGRSLNGLPVEECDDGQVPERPGRTHTLYVLCNGEIYNFKEVLRRHVLTNYVSSGSDCEVIPHLYTKFGVEAVIKQISGEFAFIIVDVDQEGHAMTVHAARDPVGVRPLFWANDERGLALCSELKGLVDVVRHPLPFPPGSIMSARFTITDQTTLAEPEINWAQFYRCDYPAAPPVELSLLPQIYARIREVFTTCVCERLMSDRPLGALLSGGLDSSLVAAIAAQELKKRSPDSHLRTFTIGMPGSTDVKFAQIVANHISSEHHVVELQAEDFLKAIPEVVYAIESYDITTVRASTGQFLVSKYISANTDIKVLLIGDGSDEVAAGYLYFHLAPSPLEAHEEAMRLVRELFVYDVLRADRSTAYHGLEARVPFLDRKFVDFYMKLPPELRAPRPSELLGSGTRKVEKPLLREAFAGTGLLPDAVLKRTKEAFSDGVSSQQHSWYRLIQEDLDRKVSDAEFEEKAAHYTHLRPHTKEALHYRQLFGLYYQEDNSHVVPHFWLPRWQPPGSAGNQEPSARALAVYTELSPDP